LQIIFDYQAEILGAVNGMMGGWLELALGGVDGKLYILLCFPMAIGITTDTFDAILFKYSNAGGNRPCRKRKSFCNFCLTGMYIG